MTGSPSQTDIWAKLKKEDGNIVAWHPLLAHSADVAAVFYYLVTKTVLRKRFAYAADLEDLTHTHAQRLTYLAAMHDIGKVCEGFQKRARQSSGTDHLTPLLSHKHGQFTGELFNIAAVNTWFDGHPYNWILATICHHGGPINPRAVDVMSKAWDGRKQQAREVVKVVRDWFSYLDKEVKPFSDNPQLQHLFNGVLTLADWIGSDGRFFGFENLQVPRGMLGPNAVAERAEWAEDIALKRASRAVTTLGLNTKRSRTALPQGTDISNILGKYKPYDVQQTVNDLKTGKNGSIVVLESDTGSGKTEAAIARFLKLYQAGEVDGMYFAVPTRSAATELHARVTNIVQRLFPKGKAPMTAQAVPGQAKADHNVGIRISPFDVDWKNAKLQHRNWAAEGSKKYLAAPVAVGTIDQAFMSVLQVKHAHMRSAALSRHLLVIDEVHSSDIYMTELQTKVVENQLAVGGHVLLMSATIGSEARNKLLTGNWPTNSNIAAAKQEKYPLVSSNISGKIKKTYAKSSGSQKNVQVQHESLAENPTSLAKQTIKHAKAGAKVLIIRNRVDDCVETHKEVERLLDAKNKHLLFSVGGITTPHHSRYSGADRRALDKQIERDIGKGSARGTGKIIIATSTVEQSLDIDADVLYSDLCPIDVLLQRIGRLHRHANTRPPGYQTAKVFVLTNGQGDLIGAIDEHGKVEFYKLYAGLGRIHTDLRPLEATRRLIVPNPSWSIPRDNRTLVENATHSDVIKQLEAEDSRWKRHGRRIYARMRSHKTTAKLVSINFDKPFGDLMPFRDLDQHARTRLGIDNYDVIFDGVKGPFGTNVYKLSVPGWWLPEKVNSDTPETVKCTSKGFEFMFCGRGFIYTRFGLQKLN